MFEILPRNWINKSPKMSLAASENACLKPIKTPSRLSIVYCRHYAFLRCGGVSVNLLYNNQQFNHFIGGFWFFLLNLCFYVFVSFL